MRSGLFGFCWILILTACSGESASIFLTDLGNPVIFDDELGFSEEEKEDVIIQLNAGESALVDTVTKIVNVSTEELTNLARFEPLARRYTTEDFDWLGERDNGVLIPFSDQCIIKRSDLGVYADYLHKYIYGKVDKRLSNKEFWIPMLQTACELKEPLCGIPCDTNYQELFGLPEVSIAPVPPPPGHKHKHKHNHKRCNKHNGGHYIDQ
jgi:hypothetical protein